MSVSRRHAWSTMMASGVHWGSCMQLPQTLHTTSSPSLSVASVSHAKIEIVLRAALTAPSGDNTQPWTVTLRNDGFDIRFVAARAECFLDVQDVASRLSLGALLETAAIAASQIGLLLHAELDPDQTDSALWARVRCTPTLANEHPLHDAIAARHTNRRMFDGSTLSNDEEAQFLVERADDVDLRLLVDRKQIAAAARIIGAADSIRAHTRAAHEDLHRWLRWSAVDARTTRDGLDVNTLGLNGVQAMALRLTAPWGRMRVALAMGVGRMHAAYGRKLVQSSSAVGLIAVPSSSVTNTVSAGRLLQRVWLRATAMGLAFSPAATLPMLLQRLREPDESHFVARDRARLDRAEAELRALFMLGPDQVPLMLFRVGRAAPMKTRSLRRALVDVLHT